MNRLFLLIPAIKEEDAGQDIAYLKLLGEPCSDEIVTILKKIIKSLDYIQEEDVDIVYDNRHLSQLYHQAKKEQTENDGRGDMPQIENLFLFFNDAVSLQDLKLSAIPLKVNGLAVEAGIINAFFENDTSHDTLLNRDALSNPDKPVDIEVKEKTIRLKPLDCDASEVYIWLVQNRFPKRVIDKNYMKHTTNQKRGKKGVNVSAITYSEQQIQSFLEKAVVAKRGLRELYFKDLDNNKIIIFFNENLETPTFHVFEVDADDKQEIRKINKRGGNSLMKRIEAVAALK